MWNLYCEGILLKSFNTAEEAQKYWKNLTLDKSGKCVFRFEEE